MSKTKKYLLFPVFAAVVLFRIFGELVTRFGEWIEKHADGAGAKLTGDPYWWLSD